MISFSDILAQLKAASDALQAKINPHHQTGAVADPTLGNLHALVTKLHAQLAPHASELDVALPTSPIVLPVVELSSKKK